MNRKSQRKQRGFTLIELLVVLAILAMLAGVVGPKVMNALSSSKSKTALVQINDLGGALDMYKLDMGNYPASLEALVKSPGDNRWNGPYLKKNTIPKDPWGNEYQYSFPGNNGDYDLASLGADAAVGGDGENKDVVSWE